jgi:hypothetical protein
MAIEVEETAKITHLALLMGQPIILTLEQLGQMDDLYTVVSLISRAG